MADMTPSDQAVVNANADCACPWYVEKRNVITFGVFAATAVTAAVVTGRGKGRGARPTLIAGVGATTAGLALLLLQAAVK